MSYLWYFFYGEEEKEEQANPETLRQRHLVLKQIKLSNFRLKSTQSGDIKKIMKTRRRNQRRKGKRRDAGNSNFQTCKNRFESLSA